MGNPTKEHAITYVHNLSLLFQFPMVPQCNHYSSIEEYTAAKIGDIESLKIIFLDTFKSVFFKWHHLFNQKEIFDLFFNVLPFGEKNPFEINLLILAVMFNDNPIVLYKENADNLLHFLFTWICSKK